MPRGPAIATDPFTSTTQEALGANWLSVNPGNAGDVVKTGGVFHGEFAALVAAAVWAGAGTFSTDQYSKAIFVETDFDISSYGIGVIARASTGVDAARNYYYFLALSNETGVLGKVVDGTDNGGFHTGAVPWVDGDAIELECEGTTIRACRNGTPLGGSFTVTDSSLSAGKPGILAMGEVAAVSGDNWEGGNITAGGGRTTKNTRPFPLGIAAGMGFGLSGSRMVATPTLAQVRRYGKKAA